VAVCAFFDSLWSFDWFCCLFFLLALLFFDFFDFLDGRSGTILPTISGSWSIASLAAFFFFLLLAFFCFLRRSCFDFKPAADVAASTGVVFFLAYRMAWIYTSDTETIQQRTQVNKSMKVSRDKYKAKTNKRKTE
jgi:hypothetical protein